MSALSSAQEPLAVVAHAGGVNEQAEAPEEEEWKVSNCTLFFDLVYVVAESGRRARPSGAAS